MGKDSKNSAITKLQKERLLSLWMQKKEYLCKTVKI
jgi:hypothetical protein